MLLVEANKRSVDFDFITLTSSAKNKTFAQTLHVLPMAWQSLYNRLKRYDPAFSYILVPELHKNGRVHIHMLTDFQVPARYTLKRKKVANRQVRRIRDPGMMSRFWRDIPPASGFGWSCDQEHIGGDTAKVAGYIAKYLAKQLALNAWPLHFKHVRASHGVPDLPRETTLLDQFEWAVYMQQSEVQAQLSTLARLGYRLIVPNTGEILKL